MDLRASALPEVLREHRAQGEGASHWRVRMRGGHSEGRGRAAGGGAGLHAGAPGHLGGTFTPCL